MKKASLISAFLSYLPLEKSFLFILCLLFLFSPTYAQTKIKSDTSSPPQKKKPIRLDWREIRTAPVRFQNYNKKRAPRSLEVDDLQIGENLATSISNSNQADVSGIEVQRVFNPEQSRLGADIVRIKGKSTIGHVNRIQRILSSYLETKFGYSIKEAKIASRLILYYNAHNRGNLPFVQKRYSSQVVQNIVPEKIGIDRSYKNWIGKTELLLPLRKNILLPQETDLNLKESRKGSGPIANKDKKVFQQLEKDRNKKEIIGLTKKSKELKKSAKEIQKEKKEIQKSNQKIQKEKEVNEKKIKELKKDPRKNALTIKKVEQKQKKIEEKQKKIETKKKEIQKRQTRIEKKQEQVSKQKKEAKDNAKSLKNESKESLPTRSLAKTKSPEKERDTQKELEKLKKENKILKAEKKEKPSENIVADKLLFMRVLRYTKKGHYKNELWYIDANKNDTLLRSSFTNICSRDFTVIPNIGVAITGYKGSVDSNDNHHLVLLDIQKLRKVKESKTSVHWRTPIIERNSKIYAFEKKGKKYYLARFNKNLLLEKRSNDSINPFAKITFYKGKIYLTGSSNKNKDTKIHVFKETDLSTIKIIDPKALVSQNTL